MGHSPERMRSCKVEVLGETSVRKSLIVVDEFGLLKTVEVARRSSEVGQRGGETGSGSEGRVVREERGSARERRREEGRIGGGSGREQAAVLPRPEAVQEERQLRPRTQRQEAQQEESVENFHGPVGRENAHSFHFTFFVPIR